MRVTQFEFVCVFHMWFAGRAACTCHDLHTAMLCRSCVFQVEMEW